MLFRSNKAGKIKITIDKAPQRISHLHGGGHNSKDISRYSSKKGSNGHKTITYKRKIRYEAQHNHKFSKMMIENKEIKKKLLSGHSRVSGTHQKNRL